MISISDQIKMTEQAAIRAERSFKARPDGTLIVAKRGSSVKYYHQTEHGRKRRYLPRTQDKAIRKLAQTEYDKSFLKAAEDLIKTLKIIEKAGAQRSVAYLYKALTKPFDDLSEERKRLVIPYIMPTEDYVREWENKPCKTLAADEDKAFFITEKGDRVRSKSEKIIADKLFHMEIPYRYEAVLNLQGINVHPDFTLLDVQERTEIYFEHFGMMQDPDYCRNALNKIARYEKCGYHLGRELLCTFESDENPLDVKALDRILVRYKRK